MKSIYSKLVLVSLLVAGISGTAVARECTTCSKPNTKSATARTKAAVCKRAQSTAELSINNVRAQINGYGNMWYDGSVAQYHIPKNGNTSPLYCAALWIGGTDVNDQLRIAALRFGQNGDDFWPGPLKIDNTAAVDLEVCNRYDKHYVITKAEVQDLISHYQDGTINSAGYKIPDVIQNWPAKGEGENVSNYLAPFFDADGDGEYHPDAGDYPYYDFDNDLCPRKIKAEHPGQNYVSLPTMETSAGIVTGGILSDQVLKGDQTIWWVFNDMGNTHTETGGQPIGLEIRAQAFAFSTNDEINNMTFYSYEIINRSTYELRETYFSQWVDPDLGYAYDDYVGCDVKRGLGYCYNGDETDGPGAGSYSGIPPAVGIDFFQGPYMDPDGKDNPKIDIPWIVSNGNTQLKQLLNKYKMKKTNGQDSVDNRGRQVYDTIAVTDDADLFYAIDFMSWYNPINHPGDVVGSCAINGVNFGNNIIDDERFGMRRFVYYNNSGTDLISGEPSKANDYYNYLRGYWMNGQRMHYGGNAVSGANVTELECDFMYPGNSDPWHWGTGGQIPTINADDWTEANIGNPVSDRRFMQSAGPFTLKPGALNYITVGIPFAQASSAPAWNSVELLRQIDDVCQSLFENCFKVLDGPDAPTMTCQELSNEVILYLHYDNPESNNYGESYSETDPGIVRSFYDDDNNLVEYTEDQRSFKFEGYQIYQLADANASIADIGDPTKARLVAQCDIENYYDSTKTRPIGTLVNYTTNSQTGILTGEIMVEGANRGIQHVFRITNDAFASGQNTNLVNNKEYYYVAVAYSYNCYKEYSQTDATFLDGQKEPYLAGRKNERGGSITAIKCIPHNPAAEDGGKLAQAEFGMCPNIVRLEGYGNGGSMLRMANSSIEELMGKAGEPAKAPGMFVTRFTSTGDVSYMTNPCIIANPLYEENYGPINIRVIDPLKIKEGSYNLLFWNKQQQGANIVNDSAAGINANTQWCVVRSDGGQIPIPTSTGDIEYVDTVWSDFYISRYNEQIFLELGLAVTLVNPEAAATPLDDPAYSDNGRPFYGGFINKGSLLGNEIKFANENYQWLSGIPDNDNAMITNWIRSGTQFAENGYVSFYGGSTPYSMAEVHLDEDYFKTYIPTRQTNSRSSSEAFDKNQEFESVIGGLWSPYAMVSTLPFHPGFNFSYYMPEDYILDSLNILSNKYKIQRHLMTNVYNKALNLCDLSQLPSVRIVFTADTSKWTRCPVVEMCDDYTQSEGNARKFSARAHASVDKLGRTCDSLGIAPDVDDPNNPAYISAEGMGWFPGYAINVVTGERLNIMFGEDSRYVQYNGRDMLWNPTYTMTDGTQNYVFGGRHFVYVMNACNQPFFNIRNNTNDIVYYRTPSYDGGRWAMQMLSSVKRLMSTKFFDRGRWAIYNGVIDDEYDDPSRSIRDSISLLYASVAWVNMPLVSPQYTFYYPGHDETLNANSAYNGIPCDVTINIDVRTPYGLCLSPNATPIQRTDPSAVAINKNMPAYQFRLNASDAVLENLATATDARKSYQDSLLSAINVVPNPYYSYSKYETLSQLETKVRIVNLPTGVENGAKEGCIIRIYTVDGTLVRTIGPTPANVTTIDWDLHNQTGIPIAGGMYLIHVSVPGIGERVIKWFGTMRPVDLNSFQF